MTCINNYVPQPSRTWYRVQNSISLITNIDNNGFVKVPYTNEIIPASFLGDKLAMLNKGNILQYKSNSSNLTQSQRYSKIAKGQWTNRNTTWATQSARGYTNPNTTSLKRSGNNINIAIDPITGAIIGPTAASVTCPQFHLQINEYLPSNGGGGSSIDEPEIPPPIEPTPESDVFPEIIPDTPIKPIVIQDEGVLICSIQENICTGEIKIHISQQLYNPTSDSDVPGQIQYLYWNDGTQTWYPRQRSIMSNSNSTSNFAFVYNIAPSFSPLPTTPEPPNGNCEICNTINNDTHNNPIIKEIEEIFNETVLITPDNVDISIDQLNTYLINLHNLKNNCNSEIIANYENSIKLMFIISNINIEKYNAITTSETYKLDSVTLNDRTLLEEWIKNNTTKYGLFGDVIVQPAAASLKPEYLEYQRLYGMPPNLVFDPEKLQNIKDKIYK